MSQAAIIGVVALMMMSSSAGAAFFMMGGDDDNKTGPTGPAPPTQYVYEFIKNIESAHTKDYNVHITDIRVDGKRVTSDQIQLHEEPEWAKCNSKDGGYQCEGTNYGLNDPEPANPTYADLTWSAWKEGQIPVGSKVMTITTLSKVKEFEIDYFRPKYVPGWIIKENGKEVLKEIANGGSEDVPNPKTVKYTIPQN
jgi:hypothetical protein